VENCKHRHAAELDFLKRTVPVLRMPDACHQVRLAADLAEIQPGTEMLALATKNNSAYGGWQGGESVMQTAHGLIVECVAFLGTLDADYRNRTVHGQAEC
jgi:hypothetical protein